jgi:undecaprenyl diphosphate synthase
LADGTKEDGKTPRHVGIIMDGNRRWAAKRGLPGVMGHQAGMKALEDTVINARDLGIRFFSVYAFSTENWKRSAAEIDALMGLFRLYLKNKIEDLKRHGVRIRFAGKMNAFPEDILNGVRAAEEYTKNNAVIDMIICANYGGRQEIIDAVNRVLTEHPGALATEELLDGKMYLPDVPYPDLLIRTGGELRMSNFWLWEGAYSEYYFTDTYWPEFDRAELERALESYAGRERRYGAA